MLSVLIRKTLHDHRRLALWWGMGLLAIGGVELWAYTFMAKAGPGAQEFVNSFPEPMRKMFRMEDYFSGPGFLGTELYSFMVQFVFIAIGATLGAAATAAEEERRTADILLALPVRRRQVLLSKMAALVIIQAIVATAFVAFLWVAMPFADMTAPIGNVIAATMMCALLGLLCAGIAYLLGALTGHRSIALAVAMAVAIASFLVYSLAPMVDVLDTVVNVVPWQWAMGNGPLTNGFDLPHLGLLVGTTIAFGAAAIVLYERRDIAN